MELLLDNPLTMMEGPVFLVLYSFVILFTLLGLGYVRTRVDVTDKFSPPAIPSDPKPFEIAFLRGGVNELARAVIFSLMQKGYIEIIPDVTSPSLRRTDAAALPQRLDRFEETGLQWLDSERKVDEVFQARTGLAERLRPIAGVFESNLRQQQLLVPDESAVAMRRWRRAAMLLIAALGGYKVLAALAHGRTNIIFTVILAVVGVVIATVIGRLPRVTRRGKLFLERVQLAYGNLKYQAQAPYIRGGEQQSVPAASFGAVDPLLLSVGVFGTGILAGTMFSGYNDAFKKAQESSGGYSGGCGSSCSSDGGGSSSCGSGCGGGGCGGGCGG